MIQQERFSEDCELQRTVADSTGGSCKCRVGRRHVSTLLFGSIFQLFNGKPIVGEISQPFLAGYAPPMNVEMMYSGGSNVAFSKDPELS